MGQQSEMFPLSKQRDSEPEREERPASRGRETEQQRQAQFKAQMQQFDAVISPSPPTFAFLRKVVKVLKQTPWPDSEKAKKPVGKQPTS